MNVEQSGPSNINTDWAVLWAQMTLLLKTVYCSPDCCGSLGWASSHKPRGHCLSFWSETSGHMPVLWVRSLVGGVQEATDRCFSGILMFLSSSFSLPSPLPKNEQITSFKKSSVLIPSSHTPGVTFVCYIVSRYYKAIPRSIVKLSFLFTTFDVIFTSRCFYRLDRARVQFLLAKVFKFD